MRKLLSRVWRFFKRESGKMSFNLGAIESALRDTMTVLPIVGEFAGALSTAFPQVAGLKAAMIAVEAVIALEPNLAGSADVLRKTVAQIHGG